MADNYVKLAANHRKQADLHRRMLAAYERLVVDFAAQTPPPPKRGKTVPLGKHAKSPKQDPIARYRAHCETYILGSELLAGEAEELAEFHRARAQELLEAKEP